MKAALHRLELRKDIATIIDVEKLRKILEDWPNHEPNQYGRTSRPVNRSTSSSFRDGIVHHYGKSDQFEPRGPLYSGSTG